MNQLRKYIRKVLKESIEEAYPESFNMETFKSLRNHAERNRYAAEHLQKIAAGSSRIVYKIDDEKVLKLAKNNKGIAQNETEIQWGNDSYFGGILATTFDSDDNALWVEMELARKINKYEFKKLTGFDINDVHIYFLIWEAENNGRRAYWSLEPELIAKMNEDEFITQIKEFSDAADIQIGDFGVASSYGVVKRNGHEVLVITDYGLTKDVYQTHYEKPKAKRYASMYESILELVKKTLNENIEPSLSDNFKNWFDGSKVVDANGNPMPVHHGTSKKFSKFNFKNAPQQIIWFTSNKSAIEAGEVGAAGKGHIMDLYASIKNPAGWDEYQKYGLGQLESMGYDGAILPDPDGTFTGFVFEPSQLKSVNNKGEWNPGDKNIYKESEFGDNYDFSKHNFNSGDCDIYAVSLHRLYGYPLYVVRGHFLEPEWGGEREWDYEDSHIVVKLPNGHYMDSQGETTEADLKQNTAYSNDIQKITIEPLTEEEALSTFSCENQEPAIKQVMHYIKSKENITEDLEGGKKKLNKYVYHVASPNLRDRIEKNGIIPFRGNQWMSDTDIKGEAVFATNSDNPNDWFDSTYDDDVWKIDTTKIPNAKWFMDPNFGWDKKYKHIYTKSAIPKNAIELIKKGTGEDRLDETKILDEIERRDSWKKEIEQVARQLNVQLTNYLGSGVWGIAYEIPDNKVLKITEDEREVNNAKHIVGKKNKLLADIYKIYSIKGSKDKKVIIMEKLAPLTNDYVKALDIFGGYFNEFYNEEWTWGEMRFNGYEEDFDEFLKSAKYDGIPLSDIYSDILQILDEAGKNGIDLTDLHEGNLGLKNGNLAAFDLS